MSALERAKAALGPADAPWIDPPVLLEELDELVDAGVTWVSVKARSPHRAAFLENIQRWGEEVLARYRARTKDG